MLEEEVGIMVKSNRSSLVNRTRRTNFHSYRSVSTNNILATVLISTLMFGFIQEAAASPIVDPLETVSTVYSSAWINKSPKFSPDQNQMDKQYYYEAIELSVSAMGNYVFTGKSSINTYGYIYLNEFNPKAPKLNLISESANTDGKKQFKINALLQPDHKYILVATTSSPDMTGKFSIMSTGPATVNFPSQSVSKAVRSRRAIPAEPRATSTYSSSLLVTSQTYLRPGGVSGESYYFKAIQVTVRTEGTYVLASNSSLDTLGYLYDTYFDPSDALVNLITGDDDSGENFQFSLRAFLRVGRTYVLVITTHGEAETGRFVVTVIGPGVAGVIAINPTTSRPVVTLSPTPALSTMYSGVLSSSSQSFLRPEGDTDFLYYFQALQVTVTRAGSYVFESDSDLDTLGFFYDTTFDPSTPLLHLMTDDDDGSDNPLQFRIQVYLQPSRVYILVVTTHREYDTGAFSVSGVGPTAPAFVLFTPSTSQPIVTPTTVATGSTTYSLGLTVNSPIFPRPFTFGEYFYYQALQLNISTTGSYVFESRSQIDTMGFLYENSFDPSDPLINLVTDDDDGGELDLQFRVEAYLQATNKVYILVVTTHRQYTTGGILLSASGPTVVGFSSITPVTSRPIVIPTTAPAAVSLINGTLSLSSQAFNRPDGKVGQLYYLQAIQLNVSRSGQYKFTSVSHIDTMGYLYTGSFDPSNPLSNLVSENDNGAEIPFQFSLELYMIAGNTYILVVTTFREADIGSFQVVATGPTVVGLSPVRPTTAQPIISTSTASFVQTMFAGSLSTNSLIFYRPGGNAHDYYYYQAIQIAVSTNGPYIFTSNGSIDTRGYFYLGSFDPSDPTVHLITSDDDSGDGFQFRIQAFLHAGSTYILVVTTHREYATGNFGLLALGPASVNLMTIIPTTSRPITTIPVTSPGASSYSGALSSSSLFFIRPGSTTQNYYFYQALQVTAPVSSLYSFSSNSSIDTVGLFYRSPFDPSDPTINLITQNDDGGLSLQFKVQAYLEVGQVYILVVTTHRNNVVGSFSVSSVGPGIISFSSIIPTTSRPITSIAPTTTGPPVYTGSVSISSPSFERPEGSAGQSYYYHAIRISISMAGSYVFTSGGATDVIGYFYETYFDPYNPTTNLITDDDDSAGSLQFRISVILQAGRDYFLVVSTHRPSAVGSFSIFATGPSGASFSLFVPSTTVSTTTVTTEPVISSTYLGGLWLTYMVFNRPNADANKNYLFEAIQISVASTGNFIITSHAFFDAVGYLYENSFDPYNPSMNLLAWDDNSGGKTDFRITSTLASGSKYILVITTSQPSVNGIYMIRVNGRTPATLTPFPVVITTTTTTVTPGTTTLRASASLTTNFMITTILCLLIVSILQFRQ